MWALNLFWGVSESISKVSALAAVMVSVCEQKKPQLHLIKTRSQKPVNNSPAFHPQTIEPALGCTHLDSQNNLK
jgi:hypothetical protein